MCSHDIKFRVDLFQMQHESSEKSSLSLQDLKILKGKIRVERIKIIAMIIRTEWLARAYSSHL